MTIPAEIRHLIERVWDYLVWKDLDTTTGKWPVLTDDRYNPEMQCSTPADGDAEMEECDLAVPAKNERLLVGVYRPSR